MLMCHNPSQGKVHQSTRVEPFVKKNHVACAHLGLSFHVCFKPAFASAETKLSSIQKSIVNEHGNMRLYNANISLAAGGLTLFPCP